MEQNRNHDMQLVHTLAHYIHEGGEYERSVRSHLAVEELEPGQEMHTIRIDDVPWKDDLTGGALAFEAGTLAIPTGPGWGVDLDEEVARAHVWEPGRGPGYSGRPR